MFSHSHQIVKCALTIFIVVDSSIRYKRTALKSRLVRRFVDWSSVSFCWMHQNIHDAYNSASVCKECADVWDWDSDNRNWKAINLLQKTERLKLHIWYSRGLTLVYLFTTLAYSNKIVRIKAICPTSHDYVHALNYSSFDLRHFCLHWDTSCSYLCRIETLVQRLRNT